MNIGFTGTRSDLTELQRTKLKELIIKYKGSTFHHGDCVGADTEFHNLCKGEHEVVIIHPPIKDDLRAFSTADSLKEPKSYFARNRDIVDECDILIACPYMLSPQTGGTWYTINYAFKQNKPVIIIHQDSKLV